MAKFSDINWKNPGLFAAGVLFGTAGIKALSSKDAKKLYTNCTAAVLRAKECVMKTVTTVRKTQLIFTRVQRKSTRSAQLLRKPSRMQQRTRPPLISKKRPRPQKSKKEDTCRAFCRCF